MNKYKYNKGIILPFSAILTFIGTMLITSYMGIAINKRINLNYKIAQTKAKYNAESGIALTYTTLASAEWNEEGVELVDTNTFSGVYSINNMGKAYNIRMQSSINPQNKRPERESFAYGSSSVENIWGKSVSVIDSSSMKFELETLAEYMYLTNHENAGGAPGIFGTGGSENVFSRGKPCFGGDDILGNSLGLAGHVQTLDPMLICAGWPTPSFNNLVYITRADEEFVNSEFNTTNVDVGDPILPDFSICGCNVGQVFLFEEEPEDDTPGYEVREKVCFPLSGYNSTISGASVETTHDATEMLHFSNQNNSNAALKDTLIMTDIEFLITGGYRVKRWWYLLPPYLKADILKCPDGDCVNCNGAPNLQADCNEDGFPDYLYSHPQHLEGMPSDNGEIQNLCNGMNDTDNWDYKEFPTPGTGNWVGDITRCEVYQESLNDFHSISVDNHPNCFGNGLCIPQFFLEEESFNTNYGTWNYSQHAGGGVTRPMHYDVENFPRYFEDKGWLPDDDLSWNFIDDLPYENGGTLIQNDVINVPGNEAVIHIKGGPVRVHGVYTGRYTVVTSGYDATNPENNSLSISGNATYGGWGTYRRHAWYNSNPTLGGAPVDTIRSNIWIVGDIVNSDTDPGTGGPPQPVIFEGEEVVCDYDFPGDCGGSSNVLGLVSSANVVIANSAENRVGGIDIHASVVGLNESFVMHYWQNALTTNCNPNWPNIMPTDADCVQNPPQADNRGRSIYGVDNNENRGDIRLWGGVIQEFRGYMMRNATGPYNSGDIGMDKSYNYDNNLVFPPPYFPYLDDCPVDGYRTVRMTISDYGQID
jgi:hypothetical protein